MAKQAPITWVQSVTVRASRLHFGYVAAYMLAIVMFDSWNLITHEAVAQRWTAAGALMVVTTAVWLLSRLKLASSVPYYTAMATLVLSDILFAGFNVYTQRGMASKAVMLFLVAIVTAALLQSRSAILATASVCVAAYSIVAVRYFHLNYGEGFRVELYGEVFFSSAVFFVVAGLLVAFLNVRAKQ